MLDDLGEQVAADHAAEQAWERAADLPREEKLLVEVRYRRARGEKARAIEIYRALQQLRPTEIEHSLELAAMLPREQHLAILVELRKTSDDPRIDADEAILQSTWNLRRAIVAFDRAEAGARARNQKLLLARILVDAYPSHLLVGPHEAARKKLDEARAILEEVGDHAGVSYAVNVGADAAFFRGRLHDAISGYELAIEHARAASSEADEGGALASIGVAKTQLGDGDGAAMAFARAIEIATRVKPRSLKLINIWHGGLLLMRGDLAGAEKPAREVGATATGYMLGLIERLRGNPIAARELFDATIALDERSGDRVEAAQLRTELMRLEREAGRPAECEPHARKAIEHARAAACPNHEAAARTQLAACMIELRRTDDARAELASAKQLSTGDDDLAHAVAEAIAEARLDATTGTPPSLDTLEQLLVTAQRARYIGLELELETEIARLARDGVRAAKVKARAKRAGYLLYAK